MDKAHATELVKAALSEVTLTDGTAATEKFVGLREVDAKIREVQMILEGAEDIPPSLLARMLADPDFQANSRRVRLEAVTGYLRTALKFLDTGAFNNRKKAVSDPPDLTRLTGSIPGLKDELGRRWLEAQRCVHIAAYTSAVVMMGSILEGLLLARAQLEISHAYRSARAPRDKAGKSPAIQDWTLSQLIDVATDIGWLKSDRGKFSHALRESRNVVHPWQSVAIRANFDEATCTTSWHVLNSSVQDLLRSLP